MFCDNDISKAEKICDPNIKVHQLLVSQQTDGLDAWKESLAGIFKGISSFYEASEAGPSLFPTP
jgi:hypothetical protein